MISVKHATNHNISVFNEIPVGNHQCGILLFMGSDYGRVKSGPNCRLLPFTED